MADVFLWLGGSGAFGSAGNWNDQTTNTNPALVPPGSADTAEFASGGGTITGTGTVAQLQFFGALTWVVDANAQLSDSLGFLDNSSLTIQNGATVTSSGGGSANIDSGNTATSVAMLVTGAGSDFAVTGTTTWLYVGTTGDGSLSVTNGASATAAFLIDLGGFAGSSTVHVDATSSLEVGTAGDATAGYVTIDAPSNGNNHQILGYGTIAANVINNGYLSASPNASGFALEVTGALTGTGMISLNAGYSNNGTIVPGAVVQLDSAVGAGQQVGFAYTTSIQEATKLILDDPFAFAGTLDNFNIAGDTLDLPGQTITGVSVTGSTLNITLASGGPLAFNLALNQPVTSQLLTSSSEIRVLPIRELDWTGTTDHSFGNPGNWNDVTDGENPSPAAPGTSDLASIANAGTVTGTGTAYQLSFAGTNTVTGVLSATDSLTETSVSLAVTGTLSAASANITGTLAAKSGARITASNTLVLMPGALISADTGSSVEVGSAGTPTAGSIAVDSSGGISGDGTLAAAVINNGMIEANYAIAGDNTLEITGALTGGGLLQLSNGYNVSPDVYVLGAVVRLDSSAAGTATVQFSDTNDPAAAATLVLADPSGFAATLNGLAGPGNTLDLVGETITAASVTGSVLTVTVASGGPLTFNLGYGAPANSQMRINGSAISILPDREFVWTGATSNDVSVAGNWNDTTDANNPALTAPMATDLVQITGAGSIVGTDSVYQMQFDGTNTVAGTISAVSQMTANSGTLTVTGSLSAANIINDASLAVISGGRITTPGYINIYPGTEISVDGSSSLEVGNAGTVAAGTLAVDASSGGINGDGTLAAAVVNNGAINVYHGTAGSNVLEITGAVTGDGMMVIDQGYSASPQEIIPGGLLQLGSSIGSGQTIEFQDASDPREAPTLQLAEPSAFAGTLRDFANPGDTLQLTGETATGVSVAGTIMTVTLAVGGPLTFTLAGQTPQTDQLLASGSEVRVVPVRELDWIGPSGGSFATAANWNDITDATDPAATAPDNADLASITNAGTVTGNGTAYQFIFAGTNTFAGSLAAVNALTESSGSSTITGTLAATGISLTGTLATAAGGGITSSGPVTLAPGAMLAVDSSSFLEIGTANAATAGHLTVDTAGTVQVSGDGTLAAALVNNGQIVANSGSTGSNELEITGAVTGTGTLSAMSGYVPSPGVIIPGAVLRFDGAVAASQQVAFAASGGPGVAPEVMLQDPFGFAGTLVNFSGVGDTLDLVGETIDGASVSGTIMTVTLAAGGPLTFNLGPNEPQTSQLQAIGSEIRVVPLRDLAWIGGNGTSFGNALNWNDTSDGLNPAASAPTSSDQVSISNAGVITGNGAAYQMVFAQSNTVSGSLTAVNSLTETSGSLMVTGTLDAEAATLAGTVSATGGGQFVSAGGIQLSQGGGLAVDATSTMEIGTAGGAAAGYLTVDASGGDIIGDGTITASVVNNGGIAAANASAGQNTLEITGAVTGTGGFSIYGGGNPSPNQYTPGGILRLDASVAATQTVSWSSTSNAQEAPTLVLADPTQFQGTLSNFVNVGDTLDLVGETVTGASIVGSTLTVTVASGGPLTFNLAGTSPSTQVSYSGSNVDVVACFLAGTMILTDRGERPVETLAIGDSVMTLSGEAKPIVWIGTGQVRTTPARRDAATPIIVREGALAANVPNRDLYITKGHSLFLDDVLIPAEFLVNHRSILWDDRIGNVDFYHIELAEHDVLFANGAAAESYRDDGNRWVFNNANSRWNAKPRPPYAPVLTGGPVVDAAWHRLRQRAGPRPDMPLTEDADLHLVVDGKRMDAAWRDGDAHLFRLYHRPASVRIVSRAAEPAELGLARDPRSLGVAVRRVMVWQGWRLMLIEAADPSLTDGFHGYETDNEFRWTNGDALLPMPAWITGACDIELRVGGTTRYELIPVRGETDTSPPCVMTGFSPVTHDVLRQNNHVAAGPTL